jgi:hypothetical protein
MKKIVLAATVLLSFLGLPDVSASAELSRTSAEVSCEKPDFNNPGPYSKTTGLNVAQTLAIECASKLYKVTSKTGGKCVCFADMLMTKIGSDQIRVRSIPTASRDAGPRWNWITTQNIDKWTWGNRPQTLSPPYVIWWNNITSEPRGHMAVYIGKTRLGKNIYIDNLSRPDIANGSKVGYWVAGDSIWVQKRLPVGVTKNFIATDNNRPSNCK